MEFLGNLNVVSHSEYDIYKFEVIWRQNIEGFKDVKCVGDNCEAVYDAFIKRHRKFLETRHRMYTSFDVSAQEFNDANAAYLASKELNPEYSSALESQAHFFAREWIKTTSLWPIFYMDVMPVLHSDYFSLLHLICQRENLIEGAADKWMHLPPRDVTCHTSANWFSSVKLPSRVDAMATMLPKLEKFMAAGVRSLREKHKWAPNVDTPTIKFIFDSRRSVTRLGIHSIGGVPAIHPFDILYDLFEWDNIDQNNPLKNPSTKDKWGWVASLSYKISTWIIYDIVADYIVKTNSDLVVFIADNHALAISWFFGKMGTGLCKKNIQFVFVDAEPDTGTGYALPQPQGTPSPMSDIISIEAFYFIHYHEIFRANGRSPTVMDRGGGAQSPPTVINKMTAQGSPLYFRLLDLRRRVFEHPLLHEVLVETPEDATYNANKIRELSEIDKVTPTGAKLRFIIAAPGTGKTTYLKTKRNYAKVSRDDIRNEIHFGGLSILDRSEQLKPIIEAMIKAELIDRKTQEVVLNTFWKDIRSILNEPVSEYVDKRREGIIEDLLSRNYKVMVDTLGELILPNYTSYYSDNCWKLKRNPRPPFDVSKWFGYNCKMIFIYLSSMQTFNQQVFRYMKEKRLTRFYKWFRFYKNIWDGVYSAKFKNKIKVVAYDSRNKYYAVADAGHINKREILNFLADNSHDDTFVSFIKKNYGFVARN